MSLSAAVIAELVSAGLSGDALVAACERIEASQSTGQAVTRTARQERNARYYASKKRLKASYSDVSDGIKTVSDASRAPLTHAEPEPTKTTSSPVQKDILTDIPKVRLEKPSCGDLGFGEAWDAYPRRQGGNSRKNAEARYRKAVKSGVDPECILAGVRAYAEHCDATGKTGTEFVKTAEAWLNGRFWESDWSISLSRPAPPFRQARPNTALDGLTSIRRRFSDGNPTLQLDGRGTGRSLQRVPS